MAIGLGRMFGFRILENFNFPYISKSVAEFWRRWHISLSTWFRDYLYIPLGGSQGGTGKKIRNTFIIFAVSGFWHGANWTFIVWGLLNAIYFLPLLLTNNNRNNLEIVAKGKYLPSVKELIQILVTFGLTAFAWIFFRAENIEHAIEYISKIFSKSLFNVPNGSDFIGTSLHIYWILSLLMLFITVEWVGRNNECPLNNISLIPFKPIRWAIYILISILIVSFIGGQEKSFIYFQF